MMNPLTGRPAKADLDAVIAQLLAQYGQRATTLPGIRQTHANSLTWVAPQPPDIVVFPDTTEEIAAIVKLCAKHRVPMIPVGTGRISIV